ncbi:SRPBCC family protein [Candidatus Methylomirabilis sp.]|uniref:SRPBCC family protein n=1 Tax=Candidatus Methylomirabilis sp. TaxID=2032687 RepID=UPI003C729A9E
MLHRPKVKSLIFAASVLLLQAASLGAGESATTGLTVGELTRMEKGGAVVRTDTYPTEAGARGAKVKAYCIINKPPDVVWAVMLNYHKFDEFMPRLEKVEVLEKTPSTMKITETVRVPLGVISYTIDLIFKPAQRTVSWTLDKSKKHDIAETFGAWEFLPYSQNKTILRYTTTLDSGFFIPRFLEEFLLRNDLSDALLSLKRRTESDGTWKKKE